MQSTFNIRPRYEVWRDRADIDPRWFTSAVIDGKFDEEDDVSDSVESDEDESPGETYLVEKGVMRKLQLGMEEYEEAVRDSVRKKLAKSSIR